MMLGWEGTVSEGARAIAGEQKTCFVVMGFGVKTDLATGRKLDLDKSYKNLIKPVVEARKIACVRADEIRHSGAIDLPMYEQLLGADIVIADLSTANPNALYELGIRHALKPWTTIVISENKLSYPFDLNHVLITGYTHLGEDIGYDEVMRFRQVLGETLDAVLAQPKPDSPIYTFVQDLEPPTRKRAASVKADPGQPGQPGQGAPAAPDRTLAMLIEQGEAAIAGSCFPLARSLFEAALAIGKPSSGEKDGASVAHDPYLVQRLVLATYKAKEPDEAAALETALKLLDSLNPKESNDPETVGLAGAIEKRLFDQRKEPAHLERAIGYYGRGYYLRNDWYNGINLAYLLTLRVDTVLDATDQDRVADLVWANRVRGSVLALCEQDLMSIRERERQAAASHGNLAATHQTRSREQEFWCLATKAEAHFGRGEMEAYRQTLATAVALNPADWMMGTLNAQVERTRTLLEKHGKLLDPPWPGAR